MASIYPFHSSQPVPASPLLGVGGHQIITLRVSNIAKSPIQTSAAHSHSYLSSAGSLNFQTTPICDKPFDFLWIFRSERGMTIGAFKEGRRNVVASAETPLFGNDTVLLSFSSKSGEARYSLAIPPTYVPNTEVTVCCGVPESIHEENQNPLAQFAKLSVRDESAMEF